MADDSSEGVITPEAYGEGFRADYIAMYHEYVASAERISERRSGANTFFVTANTALLGVTEYLGKDSDILWMLGLAGLLMCVVWRELIRSYKSLNTAKFGVILDMENNLPAQPYASEWQNIQKTQKERRYKSLSDLESLTPVAFAMLHICLIFFV